MTEETSNASVNAGSVVENKIDPNTLGGGNGQSIKKETPTDVVPKTQYQELEKKLGEQGSELGELRAIKEKYNEYDKYLRDNYDLLLKLEEQPEIVNAIKDGKIDSSLAKAVMEGNVSIKDATAITEAHEEVKNELGKKEYENLTPDQLNKLVEDRFKNLSSGIEEKVKKTLEEDRANKDFEDKVKNFIRETKDYADYAEEVGKYLREHPNLADIEIAYQAVKGIRLAKEKEEAIEKEKAETAKNFATNVSTGGGNSKTIISNPEDISKFVRMTGNPNRLM